MCIVNQINHSINSIVGGGAGAGAGGGGAKPKGKPNDQVLTSHLYQVAMMVVVVLVRSSPVVNFYQMVGRLRAELEDSQRLVNSLR